MATKTPTAQQRCNYARDWGNYASAAALPNAVAGALPNPQFTQLEVGDVAYITGTGQRAYCTNKGTLSGGDAVWVAISATDHQGPKIIVGNALMGDTLAVCDYLDVGDGVQLQAALTAAGALSPAGDVWLRPGNITLATAALNIPNSVTLRASGRGAIINTTATQRRAFIVGGACGLEDINIAVPVPAVGATGTEVISIGVSNAWLKRVNITMATQTAGQAANESLTACVRTSATVGVHIVNLTMVALSFRALGIASDFVGIFIESNAGASASELWDTRVQGADIAYDLRGTVHLEGWLANTPGRIGVRLTSSATAGGQRIAPTVVNGNVRQLNIAGLTQYGAYFDTGADAAGMLFAKIAECTFDTTSAAAASTGAFFTGTGLGASLDNCSINGFPVGVDVNSATQTSVSISGYVRGYTTPVLDASGSLQNNMRYV